MVSQELPLFDDKKLYQVVGRAREGHYKSFRVFLFELYAAGMVSYTVDCVVRTVMFYDDDDACIAPHRAKITGRSNLLGPECKLGMG